MTVTDERTGDEILTEQNIIRQSARAAFGEATEWWTYVPWNPPTDDGCDWSDCPRKGNLSNAGTNGDGSVAWSSSYQWCAFHYDAGVALGRLFDLMTGAMR
mgnify:CR=1 FL=1